MVAKQREGAAAGVLGLALEFHQQVEHVASAGPAVHIVAGLDQRRLVASPPPAGVSQPGGPQDALELADRAMDVADGEHARRTLGAGRLGRVAEEDEGNQQRNATHAPS